jgi:hypothetical protein
MSAQARLRDAAQAIAATVHEVRPLDLPSDAPAPSPAGRPWPQPRRGRGRRRLPWLVPLAAAAAVVAVAATLVAIRSMPPGRPLVSSSPLASTSAPPTATASPGPAPATAIPRYYVALNLGPHGAAAVGDTHSSQWLETVSLPANGNRFAGATGAADDRTFVVDVAQSPPANTWSDLTPRVWYLLRIAPGTDHVARFTRLPIPATPDGTLVLGIALSPDGAEFAVLSQQLERGVGPVTLRIYSVATGAALRTWTGSADRTGPGELINSGVFDPNSTLTWITGGRTLAFSYVAMTASSGGLRMLDLSRPGNDLIANSKPLPPPAARVFAAECSGIPLVTADGRTAVCGTQALPTGGIGSCSTIGRNDGGKPRFVEYSTVTGKQTRVLYQYPGSCTTGNAGIYWASPSGDALIGYLQVDQQWPKRSRFEAGLFTSGAFQPLPLQLSTYVF